MKTHINLGIAFIDAKGLRRLSFELMHAGRAIACADFDGVAPRFIKSDKCPDRIAEEFRATVSKLADDSEKSLEWSYPTSPNAEAFGFKGGCWTIHLKAPGLVNVAVRAFGNESKAQAIACLKSLPFPLSEICAKVHPEYAAI